MKVLEQIQNSMVWH